ncbi:AMP-binding protein [Arthrobacter sp. MSA 4-2]|uniref:AMP-binding protein n=1 Tax=Arthrobacter sp. MSA 4-2 TaxID=2794349 RepID=UPI0018E72197|nr:AMP-binding protein [Arthrobacter sp. MSA 4-2]MBJ2122289.1 AMP-binding protein [Arthrobacter sp. MSA 4-2]
MTSNLFLTRASFAADLAHHGDRPAVLIDGSTLSYRELARRVEAFAARLGTQRRLVALAAANDLESLIAYLAALTAGHPLILVPADKPAALDSIVAAYDPDVVLRSGGFPSFEERRPGTKHELHSELALLVSTSGSTGSPKLVRLSHENLQSNAEAIAGYLAIGPEDRAATTLPLSYCYGLSVINSHLLQGAGLVLTDLSVVDPCFWELVRAHGVSSFAAVPYTFELLERVGFADLELPSLRYITQAGGRLAPEQVRRYASLGAERGWDLFVMYGATEATARMAYLPPDLAASHPGTIGIAVPGGAFRIDPVPGLDDGELVYTGPNVMLGYAEAPADLALGRTVQELRTGDLARRHPNGLYEVVGRRSRFLKIVGLRVDLGQVERILDGLGVRALSTGTDERLVVAIEGGTDVRLLGKVLAQQLGLPRAAVEVHGVDRLPRLSSGKPDYPAVLALAAAPVGAVPEAPAGDGPEDLRRIYAEHLECGAVRDDDTFASLGGDSLSYVALSVRLEKALGSLPADWHLMRVGDLARPARKARPARRFLAPLETSIVLRAVAIIFIISTHVGLFTWPGTAHVLMAVVGYNFARFQLAGERVARLRRQVRSLGRIVVPSVAFIAFAYLVTDRYSLANIALLNSLIGPRHVTAEWQFWFVEVLVYVLIFLLALLAVPWVDRAERGAPFVFPLALTALGMLGRYDLPHITVPHTAPVLWLVGLGWLMARSRTILQRSVVTAIAALSVPGFFDDAAREATLLGGLLLLTWLPAIPLPRRLHRTVGVLASSSLYAYLTHWLVFPLIEPFSPALAVGASLAAGVAYWALTQRIAGAAGRLKARRSGQPPKAPAMETASTRQGVDAVRPG